MTNGKNGNGKKSSAQLDREISDVVAARQKRGPYQTNDPRTGLRPAVHVRPRRDAGLPTQSSIDLVVKI